ncbi:hypothetical protein [Rhodoferax lacus]|nr:hypothetical protein [Rhodoferax lacus]
MTNHDLNSVSGFYAVDLDVYLQTLEECIILQSFEMGGGVVIHYGMRGSSPAWLMDNPHGLYAIWVEDAGAVH